MPAEVVVVVKASQFNLQLIYNQGACSFTVGIFYIKKAPELGALAV